MSMIGSSAASLPGRERPDSELVEAARGGSALAFSELVERYQNLVRAIAYALTGDLGQSEDVAQDAFVAAWKCLTDLRNPDSFRDWLCGITRNVSGRSREAHRLRSRLRTVSAADGMISDEPSALERIIKREEEVTLRRALRRLPEAYRVPLVLFYREEKSIQRVSKAMGLSEGTVKLRLFRGRQMLQDHLASLLESALGRTRSRNGFAAAVLAAIFTVEVGRAEAARPSTRLAKAGAVALAVPLALLGSYFASPLRELPPGATSTPTRAEVVGPNRPEGIRPAHPPRLDMSRRPAFAGAPADDRTVAVASFDFEDGAEPVSLQTGHVTTAFCSNGSRYCLVGEVALSWPKFTIVRLSINAPGFDKAREKSIFHCSKNAAIVFDYWLGEGEDQIEVELSDDVGGKSSLFMKDVVHESWTTAVVRKEDLSFVHPGMHPLDVSAPTIALLISGGRVGGKPFYVDNIRIVDDVSP